MKYYKLNNFHKLRCWFVVKANKKQNQFHSLVLELLPSWNHLVASGLLKCLLPMSIKTFWEMSYLPKITFIMWLKTLMRSKLKMRFQTNANDLALKMLYWKQRKIQTPATIYKISANSISNNLIYKFLFNLILGSYATTRYLHNKCLFDICLLMHSTLRFLQ